MEILFENRYRMTRERYKEWAKNPIKKNYFTIIWFILMIFTIFLSIISVLSGDMYFIILSILMIVYCMYRGFFRRKLLLAKQFKVISTNQGVTEWDRIIQFSDNITVIDGNTTTEYKWDQIVSMTDSKNYLILVFKNEFGIRLDKNGFTKGTSENFIEYMRKEHQSIIIK